LTVNKIEGSNQVSYGKKVLQKYYESGFLLKCWLRNY